MTTQSVLKPTDKQRKLALSVHLDTSRTFLQLLYIAVTFQQHNYCNSLRKV